MFFLFGYPFIFLLPFFLALLAVRAGSRYFSQTGGQRPVGGWGPHADIFPDEARSQRIRGIEARVFKLAYRLHGRITVSDVVVDTGLSVDEAERILERMVDNQRVRMDVTQAGLMIYEFPEIIARLQGANGPLSWEDHEVVEPQRDSAQASQGPSRDSRGRSA